VLQRGQAAKMSWKAAIEADGGNSLTRRGNGRQEPQVRCNAGSARNPPAELGGKNSGGKKVHAAGRTIS